MKKQVKKVAPKKTVTKKAPAVSAAQLQKENTYLKEEVNRLNGITKFLEETLNAQNKLISLTEK